MDNARGNCDLAEGHRDKARNLPITTHTSPAFTNYFFCKS